MIEKIKKVEIKDCGEVKHFAIRLFDPLAGLDFIDRVIGLMAGDKSKISVRPLLGDLLPLATLVGADGTTKIADMSLDKANTYFQNPLAVLELGMKIFEHQMVFMNESEIFRPFAETLRGTLGMPTSDSATPSATL